MVLMQHQVISFLIKEYFVDYDCYFLCLPAHGYTKLENEHDLNPIAFSDKIINLINEIELSSFVLIGHSLGGGIASMVAQVMVNRVEKLILVCPLIIIVLIKGFKLYLSFPIFSKTLP